MDRDRLKDALDSLTKSELRVLRENIDHRLLACLICGSDGAQIYRVVGQKHASLSLCAKCFNKHRLPESWVTARGIRTKPGEDEIATGDEPSAQ